MGAGLGTQLRLGDDDNIQRLPELFMETLPLIDTGLHVPLDSGLFEGGYGEVVGIDLVAILATRPAADIRASVGDREGGSAPECGNQMQVMLLGHLEGVGVAAVSVEDQGGQRDHPGEPVQQSTEQAGETPALRRARAVRFGGVLAALGTPGTALD